MNVKKLVFSISDSSQIEAIKQVNVFCVVDVVLSDFERAQAPPDTLYEVSIG